MHEGAPAPQEARKPGPDKDDRSAALKIALGLLLVILFVLFIIQNSKRVEVDFVFFQKRIRLVWVFLACAVLGAVAAWLIGRPRRRAQRRLIEELERQRREND